jgi:hypothetical protein
LTPNIGLKMKQALSEIFILKKTFFALQFPEELAGEKINGIELVLLDADCAGLVDKFLGRRGTKGTLDNNDCQLLKKLKMEIDTVLPYLSGNAKNRFAILEKLVNQTLTFIEQLQMGNAK